MLHSTRTFQITTVARAETLAEQLTQHIWCGCTGFRLGNLLFLNDSTSPDGAQEYGVFRDGHQVESITFGWCTQAKALTYIQRLQDGSLGEAPFASLAAHQIQTPTAHGRCRHCA